MSRRVLHVLSQRPGRTGSGVTLDALVREADRAGWTQEVVVGTPGTDPQPPVGVLAPEHVHPLVFGTAPLDFPLPGMSDVMPYESSRWQDLDARQLDAYRDAWRGHIGPIVERFRPDVIHAHHMWVLGAMLKDVAPDVPVVVHTHATGLRQMTLCPHLAAEVRAGCSRNDRFLVLTHDLRRRTAEALGIPEERIEVVGAGYRDDLFDARGIRHLPPDAMLYVGKYSRAKGLPWLLDVVERLAGRAWSWTLHVAGSGEGEEADALRERMREMAPNVVMHGHLDQPDLADLMQRCSLFVLPSFYEGLPLVVVEAVASGMRAVVTDLPTVREELAPRLGDALRLIPLPRLRGVDEPEPADLPAFVDRLEEAILAAAAFARGEGPELREGPDLRAFTWSAVFERVEAVWRALTA
jgi:glycosyltransferase involved in cell wall biosynthesis